MLAIASPFAWGPAISRAGSPGATRERKKVNSETPHRTKAMNRSRRRSRRPTRRFPIQVRAGTSAARQRVEVPGLDIERVEVVALDVGPEVRVIELLPDRDPGRIRVDQDVLGLLERRDQLRVVGLGEAVVDDLVDGGVLVVAGVVAGAIR